MNKKILLTACPIIVVGGVGAGVYGFHKYKESNKAMSNEQQVEFTNQIANQVATGVSLDKLQDEMDKNINKLDNKNASKAINTYIFDLYQLNSQYISILNDIKPMIDNITQEKKIDITQEDCMNQLNDGVVKGFLQELRNSHLVLKNDAGNYYISVDMQYILDTYKKNLSPDLKAFIEFRINEDKVKIFNSDTQTFNLDEVAKRINEIEKAEKEYAKSDYINQWQSTKQYYYNIMFQVNHQFFNDKDCKVKPEIIKDYEKYINDYKDTQLANNLKIIYDILKSDNSATNPKYLEATNNIIKDTFQNVTPDNNVGSTDKTK